MDENVPDWLDEKFLTNLLREEEKEDANVEVVSFSVKPAVAPGTNYLSYMHRVRVEYKTGDPSIHKTASLMVKVPFADGFMKELAAQHNFFDKEPKMYNEVVPLLNKLSLCDFGPKCFNSHGKNVLIMEDLKEDGYIPKDKTKQLDFSHGKIVLTKLAKFHAASVVCLNNNRELVEEVGEDHFYDVGGALDILIGQALKNTMKTITSDERYKRLADFVRDRYDQIWPTCSKLTKPKTDGGFNVLTHGDVWSNNLLFKYNSHGEVVDVKFIDYQLCRIGSPANDLMYFLWNSGNEEVRGKRQPELLGIYLNTLNETLADLGCEERLSEEELLDDVKRSVDYVIVLYSLFVPLITTSPENIPDIASLTAEDMETEKFHKLFKSENYKKLTPKYLQQITELFIDGKGLAIQNN